MIACDVFRIFADTADVLYSQQRSRILTDQTGIQVDTSYSSDTSVREHPDVMGTVVDVEERAASPRLRLRPLSRPPVW